MIPYRFHPASHDERIVFGSGRPGDRSRPISGDQVAAWTTFMQGAGIRRVCCLLSADQLAYFEIDLLASYRLSFGNENVYWSPIQDFHLPDPKTLYQSILPFLWDSDAKNLPVVVHCSGGLGRTGIALAAWLIHGRGYSVKEALDEVVTMHRNPYDAVQMGIATLEELYCLLNNSNCD